MSSSTAKQCSICTKPLGKKEKKEVTTECGHTFHRDCAQKRLDTRKKADCQVCRTESALANALNGDKTTTTRITTGQSSNHTKTVGNDGKKGHTASKSALTTANGSGKREKEWRCKKCSIENTASAKRCESCGELRHAPPSSSNMTTVAAITTEKKYERQPPSKTEKRDRHHPRSESGTKKKRHDAPETTTAITNNSKEQQQRKTQEKAEWECQDCAYVNDGSDTHCATCKKRKPADSSPPNSAQQSTTPLPPIHRPSSSNLSAISVARIYPDLYASRSTTPQLASDRSPLPKIGSTSTPSKEEKTSIEAANTKIITATHVSSNKSKSSKEPPPRSPSPSPPRREAIVYICDLPSDIQDNIELERLVRHRIEKTLQVKPGDIKCYSKLGLGLIRVADDQVKDRLVNVGKIAFDPKDGNAMISFVDTLELVSYIVLDVTKEKKDLILPTVEEVSRRWIELYKGEKPRSCSQLSVQFPNIYRIVSASLDELIMAMLNQDFSIKNQFARVYFHADCSFLEDLPKSTTQDQLREAISAAIKQPNISPSSLYIQLNKKANNACILVTDIARKWATKSFLYLDGKPISKKENLTCRLLLRSVPQTFAVHTIINHQIFAGKVINHKHTGENLILELSDKNVYDECVTRGACRIDDKLILHMEACIVSSNPEESEIDAETWYETEMVRYKPDIMQFIIDGQHVIFRYKWNSSIWLEQFNRTAPHSHGAGNNATPRDRKGATFDQTRHLLRVTEMLNTIGVIRKKSYMVGDRQVQLDLDKKLKTIVYDHRSKLEQGGKNPITTTPYKTTTVEVVKDDCLIAYEHLANKGRRPVLLNMANATSPGGGYRKGDGAQEETLFRRSDYFRSLDVDLDQIQEQRPERFHCSSNCQLDPLTDQTKMYPMDEFGAIYTSGLTVFRQPENTGYAFMEKPLKDVCALAMAAYRDPKLVGNMLAPKYAVGTRKKIENIFAIAHHHKHDCLVLSALGCGAFKNPPDHIVKLFCSVMEQYAGFFKSITFAIVDDHNSGHKLNPEGNLKPFIRLDETVVEPIIPMNKPNTMFGPYRLSSDGSSVADVCIFNSTPCQFGAKCNDMYNPNHARQYDHPPLCAKACLTGKCSLTNDVVHMTSLIHRNQCQYGGECREINNDKHAREFEHPSYCQAGGACDNMTEEHLKQYRHLPLCKYSHKCMDFQKHVKIHCDAYRHSTPRCPHGSFCANFHDKKHTNGYQHPFPTPCPFTPFHCAFHTELTQASDTRKLSHDVHQHCLDFAHVCRFGRDCADKTPLHWEKSIHIARCLCPYGDKCTKITQEDHLHSFTHSNIADIRRLCKYADKCHDRRKSDHISKFRHATTFEDSGVVRYYNLNKNTNFVQNQKSNIARITSYVGNQKWKPLPSGSVPQEILDWLRNVQPVHRCNPVIFESILLHGHVMSREYMEHLKKPKFVANSVLQHSRVRRIDALQVKSCEDQAREYITALVSEEYEKNEFLGATPIAAGAGTVPPTQPLRPASASHTKTIQMREKTLSATIPQRDMDALREKAIEIAKASIKLHSNPAGIGHVPDKDLGTDKTVFSILGPHLGHYYGDVFIVFKREILHHPDANFSIQAATTFASGNAYKWRPWLGTDPGSLDERVKLYHESKLHASVPGYDYAAALELIALTSHTSHKKTMDVDLQTILQRWVTVDSHQNIEGHLPQLIPLDYIDHIYMPQNISDSLNPATRKAIDAVFKHCITVTPHEGEINQPGAKSGPTPPTQSRADYQTFVVDQLIKRLGQHAETSLSRPVRGAAITVPSTAFNDNLVLPLTISQAYTQYHTAHMQPSTDNTIYIYWQAMNGDMMLTLSNEQIDPNEKQPDLRCLICYVAAKSASSDAPYYEHASYLNYGLPFQHDMFVNKGKYAAKSSTFYVGCNTDGFMTYCLELHRSTGKVTLSHAGPNSIYNHEKISYTFGKSELDLTKLEFVHVSAGAHTVPIRNLIICFEKQADLHPIFDTEFKKGSSSTAAASAAAHAKKGDDDNGSPFSKKAADSSEKPADFFSQVKNILTGGQGSDLPPCSENINCLIQFSTNGGSHNSKFSHPCRFSELCRNQEPHLTHEPHQVPLCSYDKKCYKLSDCFHRAQYRHTDLPDFLVPCRAQRNCQDKSDNHRIKYSHGEDVFRTAVLDGSTHSPSEHKQQSQNQDHSHDQRTPCKWGSKCRDIRDEQHRAKYSHPSATQQQSDCRTPCKWGAQCRDKGSDHRTKYSHSPSGRQQQGQSEHRTPCKYGSQCRTIGDANHRAKYSHPTAQQEQDNVSSGSED